MTMTVMVTRNLPDRFRGFLASCMHEIAPGVYGEANMKKGVRERVWSVMQEWSSLIPTDGGLAMFWPSRSEPNGMAIRMMGWPKKHFIDHEGFWLAHAPLTKADDLRDLPPIESDDSS